MENIVRKGEIACNKQNLLFSQCFLPYMALIFYFKCSLKCLLQFVSFLTSKILFSGNGLNALQKNSLENIVRKKENAGYQLFKTIGP